MIIKCMVMPIDLPLSQMQVGQVTSYNYLNMSIILVPVPECPLFSDEDIERRDSMFQANSSPYNEDGTLQVIKCMHWVAC